MNTNPEIKVLRVDSIEGAKYNPREIDPTALEGLRQSLSVFGVLELPVVNTHAGRCRLVSGHQRIDALRKEGVEEVSCIVVDFDDAKEMAANLTMNNRALQGTYDPIEVLPTLREIEAELPSSDMMGFEEMATDLRGKAEILQTSRRRVESDEDEKVPEVASSQTGSLYRLGEHYLFCGSPKAAKERFSEVCGDAVASVAISSVVDLSDESLEELFRASLDSTEDGACYLVVGATSEAIMRSAACWSDNHGRVLRWLVWAYQDAHAARSNYLSQSAFVLYGCGSSTPPVPSTARGSVLVHPKTDAPLSTSLVQDFLEDSTSTSDLIVDYNTSHGETLLAADKLGRRCFAAVSDEARCDQIRRVWSAKHSSDADSWAEDTPSL